MASRVFEAEAHRQGRAIMWRSLLVAAPLLLLPAVVIAAIQLGDTESIRIVIGLIAVFGFLVFLFFWTRYMQNRFGSQPPSVICPSCGAMAKIELPEGERHHYYLACPQCGQRADTNFGGRWSIYGA